MKAVSLHLHIKR